MKKKSLFDEIKEFNQNKKKLIPILVILGVFGLILPVLPGVLLLFLGFILLFPRQGEDFLKKIRKKLTF
ncbi:MAG: hypothetical protein ACE5HS_07290 [bacterium]